MSTLYDLRKSILSHYIYFARSDYHFPHILVSYIVTLGALSRIARSFLVVFFSHTLGERTLRIRNSAGNYGSFCEPNSLGRLPLTRNKKIEKTHNKLFHVLSQINLSAAFE